MKQDVNLEEEEKGIRDSFENGEWEPIKDKEKELNRYSSYAKAILKKEYHTKHSFLV